MKTFGFKMLVLFFLMVGGIAVMGQDRQEVPGDYFSLEGALELFKKSQSPEEFERLLNSPDSKVNNLDLNGDGETDYIRVIDRNEGNVHAFIIQAVVSSTESQDVAVIELEKLANGKAVLQITGDEDVYGIETIIEPTEEVRINAGTSTARTVVNVWTWPSVQYVYSPYYDIWVSPWDWYIRPIWWFSWRPIVYYDYYSYWRPYRSHYSYCHTHRIVYARDIYRPYRTSSPTYHKRHGTQVVHYRSKHRDDHHNRRGYGNDHKPSPRHLYTDDRTGRSRYDAGLNGRDETPVVRNRGNSGEHGNNKPTGGYNRGQDRDVDRKPSRERNEPSFGNRGNHSENNSRPNVSERSSNGQSRNIDRPSNRSERSERVDRSNRGSQQRESRSVERNDNRGRSSGGGDNKRSGNRGRDK